MSIPCPVAGDSACSIPPQTIPQECLDVIRDWTPKIAKELKVIGLINIQYAIQDNQVCRSPLKPQVYNVDVAGIDGFPDRDWLQPPWLLHIIGLRLCVCQLKQQELYTLMPVHAQLLKAGSSTT